VARQNYELEGAGEARRASAYRDWYKLRVENIREHVSAADVLTRHGVTLHRNGQQPEQMSCPFHGKDDHPSAKYFPDEGSSHSHVWCFVCHENWDVIKLWKKFTGTERFTEILHQIERAFGLTRPEPPITTLREDEAPRDPLAEESRVLFNLCESRLREFRDVFEMMPHLKLGALVDHTRFYLEHGQISHATAIERLTVILTRIAERRSAKASANT
jgi:hypothetical protein